MQVLYLKKWNSINSHRTLVSIIGSSPRERKNQVCVMYVSGKLVQSGYVPVNCSDIHNHSPDKQSGVYRIYPSGGQGRVVYCDMVTVPVDCSDIHKHWPHKQSGVYRIFPAGGQGHVVYCDMTTDGGGWTVYYYTLKYVLWIALFSWFS